MSLKVFVTGASSGLGAALAKVYAGPGAVIGLVARRAAELEAVAASLPCTTAVYALDVTDAGALARAAEDFMARHGVPDIVIANAGISAGTLTERAADLAVFKRILEVNVIGMCATFAPFIAPMRERGCGTLAGIASLAGVRGVQGSGGYCASKAAAIAYLEALRGELRPQGVKVATILPGYIRTPLTAGNPYRMPFVLEADDAARRIRRHIDRGASRAVVPWPMALVMTVLRALPAGIYDRLLALKRRKPRVDQGQKI